MQPYPPELPPGLPRAVLITSVQDAITDLLTTHQPEFLRLGVLMFMGFAATLIAWQGIRMMFVPERGLGDQVFRFAQTLLFLSIGYSMITFYETPIPGIGTSFSNLFTDQAHYFAHILNAQTVENASEQLATLRSRFLQPDPWAILPNLLYVLLMVLVALAQIVMLAVISFSKIATAVCGLLGPLFIPFFVLPKMDWLFWSWLKSIMQYSFVEVVAYAFIMIFERFVAGFVSAIPAGITEGEYVTYLLQALVVLGTFCAGILLVPSLTSSLFTGRGGESVLPSRLH